MIPKDWRIYKLGEIAEIIGGGTPSTTIEEYWNGTVPWLTPRDLTNYNFKYISKGERSITERGLNNSSTRMLPQGAVLLTSRAPIGYLAIAENPVCTNQGFKSLITDDTKVDNQFLYYLLKNNIDQIKSFGTGTTFAEVSGNTLKGIEFEFPEHKAEQSRIASILSSLDDKIELNLQMNKNLEAVAQTIFKEWFVDFRFPGFDGELVDGLPEGWLRQKLNTIIDIKHGYAFKGEFFSEEENENILLTPGNFKIGGGFNEAKLKYYCGEIPENYFLKQNDLIVTMTDLSKEGDTLGFSALVPEIVGKNLLHNQRLGKVIFKGGGHLKYYVNFIMQQPEYRHYILGGATGSTVKHTSPTRIGDYTTVIPDENTLSVFENIATALLEKVQENLSQNRTLIKIRDTLLPKLMTGKIKVA